MTATATALATTRGKKKATGHPAQAFEPMRLERRAQPHEVDRVVLFSIDDADFTMPALVETGDAIKWRTLVATQRGEDLKGVLLLRLLCGDAAVAALLDDATMTREQWAQLRQKMTAHAFGDPEEDESGN